MCDKYIDNISLYIDDMLDTDEALELQNHLNTCKACNLEYNNLLSIKNMLGNIDEIEFPENLHTNIMNAVAITKEEQTNNSNKVIKVDFRKYVAIVVSIVALLFVFSPVISNSLYKKTPEVALMKAQATPPPVQKMQTFRSIEYFANTVSISVQADDIEKTKTDILSSIDAYDNYSTSSDNQQTTLTIQLEEDQSTKLVDYITSNYKDPIITSNQESLQQDMDYVDQKLNETISIRDNSKLSEEKLTEINTEIDNIVAEKNELFKEAQLVTVTITINN